MGIQMAGPWQREKGSPYYLRMRIPADLVETLRGKKVTFSVAGELAEVKLGAEITISLRTTEAASVKARYTATMEEVQDLFSRFRALKGREAAPLTPKHLEGLAGEFYRDMCALYELDPTSSGEE